MFGDVFSENERLVIKIIGKKKMSISMVADFFYNSKEMTGDDTERKNYIAGVVRRINRKCVFNNLSWTFAGKGGGRTGRTVWKVKRESKS